MNEVAIGSSLLVVAAVLIFAGLPDRTGTPPRFLRFNAAVVVYPPIVLGFLAVGASFIVDAITGS